jgi:hypothetical protein
VYIEPILKEMSALGSPDQRTLLPCTAAEISLLEQNTHLLLPGAYKEFLLTMGKGAGDLLVGSDVFYQQIGNLQESAKEMLSEDAFPQKLPADAFVFFMHQGYQFNFFCTSEGDDPPVYRYFEGKDRDTFPLIYPHFTEFLLEELKSYARFVQRKRRQTS